MSQPPNFFTPQILPVGFGQELDANFVDYTDLRDWAPAGSTLDMTGANDETAVWNAAITSSEVLSGQAELRVPAGTLTLGTSPITPIGAAPGTLGQALTVRGVSAALDASTGTTIQNASPVNDLLLIQAWGSRVKDLQLAMAPGVTPTSGTLLHGVQAYDTTLDNLRFQGGWRQFLWDTCQRPVIRNLYGVGAIGDFCARFQGVYNGGWVIGFRFFPAYPIATGVPPISTTTDACQIGGGVNSIYFFQPQFSHSNYGLKIGDDNDTLRCEFLRFFGLGIESTYTAGLKLNTAYGCDFPSLYSNLSQGYGIWSSALMELYGGVCRFPYGGVSANGMENILLEGDPGHKFGLDVGGNVSRGVYAQMRSASPRPRFNASSGAHFGGVASTKVDTVSLAPAGIRTDRVSSIAIGQPSIKLSATPTAGDVITVSVPALSPPVSVAYTVTTQDATSSQALSTTTQHLVNALNDDPNVMENTGLAFQTVGLAPFVYASGLGASTALMVTVSAGAGVAAAVLRTLTPGDSFNLVFTSPAAAVTNVSQVVGSSDTPTTIAAALLAQLQASTPLASFVFTNPVPYILYANQQTAGWTITGNVTGSQTETIKVQPSLAYFNTSADVRGNQVGVLDYTDASPYKSISGPGTVATTSSAVRVTGNITLTAGATYSVNTGASRTLTLPALATVVDMSRITVSDLTGQSPANPITIQAATGDTINGVANSPVMLETARGKVELIADESTGTWQVIQ